MNLWCHVGVGAGASTVGLRDRHHETKITQDEITILGFENVPRGDVSMNIPQIEELVESEDL